MLVACSLLHVLLSLSLRGYLVSTDCTCLKHYARANHACFNRENVDGILHAKKYAHCPSKFASLLLSSADEL